MRTKIFPSDDNSVQNKQTKPLYSTHLVEIFNEICNAGQDTFGKTEKDSIVLGTSRVGESSQGLNNCHQQGSKTDTTKTRGQRTFETIKDRSGAEAISFFGCNPPSGHDSRNGDVNGVLQYMVMKKKHTSVSNDTYSYAFYRSKLHRPNNN